MLQTSTLVLGYHRDSRRALPRSAIPLVPQPRAAACSRGECAVAEPRRYQPAVCTIVVSRADCPVPLACGLKEQASGARELEYRQAVALGCQALVPTVQAAVRSAGDGVGGGELAEHANEAIGTVTRAAVGVEGALGAALDTALAGASELSFFFSAFWSSFWF